MSALTACRTAAFPASAPDTGPVAAPDAGSALHDGSQTPAADGAEGSPHSFQQMMNKAADAPADSGRAGSRNAATAANATAADAGAGGATGTTVAPDAPAGQTITSPGAVVAELLAAVSAGQAGDADAALAALALAGFLPANATGPTDAPSVDGVRTGRDDKPTRDSDHGTDDTLAAMLTTLAQLGFAPQVVATPTPASLPTPTPTDAAALPTLAVASQAAGVTSGAKAAATPLDQVLARMRPGLSSDAAVKVTPDSTAANAANAATRLDAAGGQIVLRDLLDGHGSDAALPRDPADTAGTITRAAESAVASAAPSADGTRAADAVTRTISIPVQHPRWADAVSSEIRWFAEQGVQNATLRLSPEHLGPVEVRVALTDGQVNVNFSAANADTRTALEQSLPRLREMLAGAGLSLGEAQVQQQMRQGSQNSFNSGGAPADTDVRDTLARVPLRLGLVDEYA